MTFNLGGFLADSKRNAPGSKKVLLVDCDPQGSLSKKFVPNIWSFSPTLKHFFDESANIPFADCIQNVMKLKMQNGEKENIAKKFENLDILPITPDSLGFFRKLENDAIYRLEEELEKIRDSYGWILIDCTNQTETCFYMALLASDYVIVPITCDTEGLECYFTTKKRLDFITKKMNPKLQLLGVVGNLFKETRKKEIQFVNEIIPQQIDPDRFFKTVIKDLSGYKESANLKIPINFLTTPSHESYRLFNKFTEEIHAIIESTRPE